MIPLIFVIWGSRWQEEDHQRFEEFLKKILEKDGDEAKVAAGGGGGRNKEPRIGIKDWYASKHYILCL